MRRFAGAIFVALAMVVPAGPAVALPVDVPPTWGGNFWDRPRLTGDWFGLRDEMGKKGIVVDLDLLQVPQGVMSGGRDTVAKYSGLAEYTLNVDTQKLGLWPGGFLNVMGMTSVGDNVNNASGALVPPPYPLDPASARRHHQRPHEPDVHAVPQPEVRDRRGQALHARRGQ